MKSLLILALIATTIAAPRVVLAENTNKTDEVSQPAEKSAKPKKKTPPGQVKKGALPPGQAKKHPPVPTDLMITNAPTTNVVARPHAEKPKVEDKRVESPRGSEALPVSRPEATNKVAKPKPETAPKGPIAAPTAAQERELESNLQRIDATWLNLTSRSSALQKIADETGTPVAQLNEQVHANAKLRGSELLMANKIAALAARTPADVLAANKGQKQWLTTGARLGADPATLLESANRVSTALR